MMGTKWYAKQGDRGGFITEQLLDENLDPVDLTAVEEIAFEMTHSTVPDTTISEIDHTEVLGDPVDGIVRYTIQEGALDIPGEYRFEWRIVFSTDRIQTFPSNGFNTLEVIRQLNG